MFSEQVNYYATIVSLTCCESSAKHTPQIAIKFNITHEQQGGEWVALERPAERTMFWALTEAAWPYAQKKLAAIGFNGNFDAPAATVDGIEVCMDWETYNGKDRERWDLAKWGDGAELKPLSRDASRKFSALWRQAAGPVPASKPGAPPKPKTAPPAAQAAPPPAMQTAGAPADGASIGDEVPY